MSQREASSLVSYIFETDLYICVYMCVCVCVCVCVCIYIYIYIYIYVLQYATGLIKKQHFQAHVS
jgi:hypothetical protein